MEGFAALVSAVNEGPDGVFEVADGVEGAAPDGWRVMIKKKISTMLSHDPLVGVKCMVTRGLLASQACTLGREWVA